MAENRIRFRADLDDKVTSKLGKMRDNFDRLGKTGGFKSLVQGVGVGVGIQAWNMLGSAAGVAGEFIADSIKASSDLNEQISKSNVVFGGASRDVEKFGDSAAQSLGLSKRAALEAAGTFGNFFTGIGKGQGEAAAMSKRLVTLAADLASFNNLDPTETLDKLRAGLAGEAEPLRRVGVFLSEAKVKAKAMELGLADANGELTEGAKITARYQIILDETATAQGDFARTSESLANQQRILNAQMEDSSAALGEKLTPLAKDATGAAISLFTALEGLGDSLSGKVTPDMIGLNVALGKMSEEQAIAALKALEHADQLDHLDESARAERRAMLGVKGATEGVNDANKDAIKSTKDLRKEFGDTARTLLDEYFDPIISRDQIMANNSEIAANKRIIASDKSKKAEIRDARARNVVLEKENLETAIKLAEAGKLTDKELRGLLRKLEGMAKQSSGSARRAIQGVIADVKKLASINAAVRIHVQGVGSSVHAGGRAAGGPVEAYGAYTVGERGPETLVMGSQGGYIIPNGGGWGGQTVIHPIMLDGKVIAEVVDRHNDAQAARSPQTRRIA